MGLESFPIQLLSVPFCLLARRCRARSELVAGAPVPFSASHFSPLFFPKITRQSRACFQCAGARIRRERQGRADSKGRDNNPRLLFPLYNCWFYRIRGWGLSKAFGSGKVPRSHSQLGSSSEEVGEIPGNPTIPDGGNGGWNVALPGPSRPPGLTFWFLRCRERFSIWKIPPRAGKAGNFFVSCPNFRNNFPFL